MPQPLRWQDPPATKRTRYDWADIATSLRANPMRWALIFEEDKASLINALRQGSIHVLHPALGFEIKTTNNKRGPGVRTATLYMRWNPAKERKDI